MMSKPIQKSICKVDIHVLNIAIQKPNSSTKTRRNSSGCNLAGFRQHRMVIDKFVLWHWELEQL